MCINDSPWPLTHCSQLHSDQLEQCKHGALSCIFMCCYECHVEAIYMAMSIGAKGTEKRDVIESIQNVQRSSATIDQVEPSRCWVAPEKR